MSTLSLFSLLVALFVAMHCAVLAVFSVLRGLSGSTGVSRVGAVGVRYAAEYVGAEALMLTAALKLRVIHLAEFSAARTAVTLLVGFVWWELWFYAGHRMLHTRWLFRFHRPHHGASGGHASLRFGAVETVVLSGGFYVPLAIASRWVGAVSVETLAITFTLAYALNVVSHLDYDLFGHRFETSVWRHVLNSTRYHSIHHAGRRANYGLNSPWFDRLFGTELHVTESTALR